MAPPLETPYSKIVSREAQVAGRKTPPNVLLTAAAQSSFLARAQCSESPIEGSVIGRTRPVAQARPAMLANLDRRVGTYRRFDRAAI